MIEALEIPEKKYFSIGEVASLCQVKPHVLRYWETEFPQLSPSKRRGNRRYYQVNDVLLVRKIKFLLYEKGFTIHGAKLNLKENVLTKDPKLQNPRITRVLPEKVVEGRISTGDYDSLKKEIGLVIDVLEGKIET